MFRKDHFRRGSKIFGAFVALTLVVYFSLTSEWMLRRIIPRLVANENLEFEFGSVAWRGRRLILSEVIANWGREGDRRRVRATIGELRVRPSLGWPARIASLTIKSPRITVIDADDGPSPTPAAGAWPAVDVDRVSLSDGSFTFVRVTNGTRAVIAARDIGGRLEAFGTSPARRADRVRGHLAGQIGFSGRTRVDFSARPAAAIALIDVVITMRDQNLRDLSEFFEPNAGVRVGGVITSATSRSRMRGDRLTTELRGSFEGLNLGVRRTRDRGAWDTFVTNLGIAVGTKSSNAGAGAREQTRVAETKRQPDDSWLSFILRGLKDAAVSVVKTPTARRATE